MAFEIGQSFPPTPLNELDTPLPTPRAPFSRYAEQITAASGKIYGRGLPSCRWIFSLLSSDQVQQLRTFCSGASAQVIITTLADDDEYHTYQAVMIWPESEDRQPATRDRLELEIKFTHLVEVEEGG